MDLDYNEEQRLIQQQARQFMLRDCPLDRAREWGAAERPLPETVWRGMAGMGWLGALIPESQGGLGLSLTDFSRLAEEMGRGLLPGSYLPTVVAALAVHLGAGDAQREALLPRVASGETRMALARTGEGGRSDLQGGRFRAESRDGGFILSGEKLAVWGLEEADRIVVAAMTGREGEKTPALGYFLVDPSAEGVVRRPLLTLDGGLRQAALRLDGVKLAPEDALDRYSEGGAALDGRIAAVFDLALAFDALGGAQRVTEMAVEYAKMRTAFGQPIGGFQAIKHKCADMLYAVESLRAAAIWCAWVLDTPGADEASPRLATALARATAIETYDGVIRHATQVMGAVACTEEHEMHLYAKRAKTLGLAFGPLAYYQEVILEENGFGLDTAAGA